MGLSKYPYIEFTGAIQQQTTPHIRKANEVYDAQNADFSSVLGGFVRRPGSQKYDSAAYPTIPQQPIAKPALGAFIAQYSTGAELWAAANVSGDATAKVRRWDPVGVNWVDVQTTLPAGAEYNFWYDLNEVWVSNYVVSTDLIGSPFTVDNTHSVSTSRQLQFAPFARFYMEFNGNMYAFNCLVGSSRFRNRFYQSSGPTGIITNSRTAQTDVLVDQTLLSQTPIMTSDTTPVGVASASTEFGSPFFAFNVFDSQLLRNNTWFSGPTAHTNTGWVRYDFGSGVTRIITAYSMTPVPTDAVLGGTTNDPASAPKNWTFEGSNDGTTWTTLDTQASAATWGVAEKRIFSITNTTAYRYYRVNVSANQGGASGQDLVMISEIQLLASATGSNSIQIQVDSARYIKPSMILDVYQAGTNNKNYTLTVVSVDKVNDIFTITPFQLNFATSAVNTTTDVITLSSTSTLPTGTPVRFTSTVGLPAGLVANTTYYVINLSSTTISLATSLVNAQLAVKVDLTTAGSGTHTIIQSYVIGNRDEFWAAGRHGLLSRFWNTDYRDPTSADWLELPATLDATNDITAVGKIASRLFVWTANSMTKYDGQNLTLLYNDVGCAAMKTVCYYQGFMVWLDSKGQIWARNEAAGTQDVISTGIQKILALVPQSSLPGATAVCVGKKYKLTLGQVTKGGSTRTLRVVYDFEANTWTTEYFSSQMLVQLENKYGGNIVPTFFDELSNYYVDELGDDDSGSIIPLDVIIGDDNLQVDEIKSFKGLKIYGKDCTSSKVLVSIDYGEWKDCGEMRTNIDALAIPKEIPKGTMINVRVTNSAGGTRPEIHKVIVYYTPEEDTFRANKLPE